MATDIDECLQTPEICRGICSNTVGSYFCTECPRHTIYDNTTMDCVVAVSKISFLFGLTIGLGCAAAVLLLGLSAILLIRRWKRHVQKKLRKKNFRKNQGLLLEQLISSDENASEKTKIFSLEELEKATDNFDPTRILGHGGHGIVYKGILSDQHVVAIKKSKVIKDGEINDFINEVAILSQINHRNIVKLFGCCLECEVPLLVYDFIPNDSLSEILHDSSRSGSSIPWNDCLRIATEAAGALYYLHSAASMSIFHRDVKSSNILLDGNYTAKVSDFGASRSVPIDQTHVSTNVQGTFGYLDPEYYQTGKLNEKSDVYSFGVVLLELLLRKQPVFTTESGMRQNLCNYFLSEMRTRPVTGIVAAEVLEEATEEEIEKVMSLAETCLRLRGEERPTMKEVDITLQLLLAERMNPSRGDTGEEQGIRPLLKRRAAASRSHRQSLSIESNNGGLNIAPQRSYTCSSLEREFLSKDFKSTQQQDHFFSLHTDGRRAASREPPPHCRRPPRLAPAQPPPGHRRCAAVAPSPARRRPVAARALVGSPSLGPPVAAPASQSQLAGRRRAAAPRALRFRKFGENGVCRGLLACSEPARRPGALK
ncbi:hypothetical protein U9M48_041152, partial [Paspalum notatum var. saurae]